jgi:hypothetical protein
MLFDTPYPIHRYDVIPQHMMDSITAYVEHGRPVGHFLTAVLSNDLREAVARADDTNLYLIPIYVSYFYNHLPSKLWGSPERVLAHIERKSEERSNARNLDQPKGENDH